MKILEVYIEHGKTSLDRPFSYLYNGEDRIEAGFRVLVPFNGQRIMGFVSKVVETSLSKAELEEKNGFSFQWIIEVIDKEHLLNQELSQLSEEISAYYLAPKISVLQAMLPPSLRPASSSLNGPKVAYEKWVKILNEDESNLTSEKQVELLRMIASNKEVLKKDCGSPSALSKLVELKKVAIFSKEKQRFHLKEYEKEQAHELTIEQRRAYDQILSSHQQVCLLHGVTGSGKTEVYLSLSEHYLKEGKSVLMLVPEISLTPIMVEYFARRFQNNVAILHSGLTPAEKYDEYRKIAKGEAHIVVGARSAIFAPLENIGLIILDEEHVDSYKNEGVPSYHAREVAIMRAKHFNSRLVLGSATPSLDSMARALKGVYQYVSLPHRVHEQALPKTHLIDLSKRYLKYDGYEIFSSLLIHKLQEKMDKNEQAVLLLNRRGYSPYIGCHDCGYVYTCPNCHSFLSYHKKDNMLKCHHCDFVMRYPDKCPQCGSEKISRAGYGTERIVKKLQEVFPKMRIGRLDSDVTKVRDNLNKTLEAFRHHEYDVLIGTQMIAKGHDFPLVTLVGIVQADIGLYSTSFKANENTFQLITQAIGRAGRSELAGEAIIQTYNPDSYAIHYGALQDYAGFYEKEMESRKLGKFPPYYYLINLKISGKNEEKVIEAAYSIKDNLLAKHFQDVYVVGPSTPYLAYFAGSYNRSLLIKFKKRDEIAPYLEKLGKLLSGKGGVEITFDVDPIDC